LMASATTGPPDDDYQPLGIREKRHMASPFHR
jgi:hypothetical protein